MAWLFYNTSGQIKQGGDTLGTDLPVGSIMPYANANAPAGWLVCDGSAVSRTTYADLFSAIGTTYGAGNGSTTFNIPDLRGKVPVGKAASGTFQNMNAQGGAETHTLSAAESGNPAHSHANTASAGNDNADHTHSGSTAGISANHFHSGGTGGASTDHAHALLNSVGAPMGFLSVPAGAIQGGSTGATGNFIGQGAQTYNSHTSGHTADHSHAFSTGFVSSDHGHSFGTGGRSAFHSHAITVTNVNNSATAASSSHNNLQPYVVTQFIIKALNVVSTDLSVSISSLMDVNTTGAVENDHLQYNATSQEWTPTPNSVPIGVVLDFYGSSLPAGFLWCDGAAIPAQYTEAISIIGANTPDLRGRVTAGRDNIGGTDAGRLSISNTLGTTTGSETVTLTEAQLASHEHTQQGTFTSGGVSSDHTHGVTVSGSGGFHWNQLNQHDTSAGAGNNFVSGIQTGSVGANSIFQPVGFTSTGGTGGISANHSHGTTLSGLTSTIGSDQAHNNMQPTMVVNKIIRVL